MLSARVGSELGLLRNPEETHGFGLELAGMESGGWCEKSLGIMVTGLQFILGAVRVLKDFK